jgi:hypothetical protein
MDVGRSLRLAALLAAAFGAGLGARVALADVVPTLPVPTTSVSVTVPPLPTTTPLPTNPLPTTPTVTTPPLPTTTSTPTTTTTPPPSGSHTTSTPSGGGGSSGGGSAQPSGSPSTSSSQTHSGAGQQPPVTVVPVTVVHTSRPVVVQNGKRGHVHATFAFQLPRAARVTLTVTQVSPACRVAGTISVRGHRGINRVPFTGRLGGRRLPPGTYKISARNRHGGAVLVATVVIVGSRKPSHAQLQTALHSNVCTTQTASRVLGAAAAGGPQQTQASGAQRQKGSKETSGGVAGASHTQASGYAPTNAKGRVSNPLVLISLAAAVLLLGVAALPHGVIPSPRLTLAVTEHRAIIAAAGAAALAAAIVALAVS